MEQKKNWLLYISISPRKQLNVKQFNQAHEELQMLANMDSEPYSLEVLIKSSRPFTLLHPTQQVMIIIIETQLHDTTPSYVTKEF